MTTTTYTLNLVEAKRAFAAILPHVSGDDVTPVITCALIDGNHIMATDRYTVARHALSEAPDEPIMLHRPAVQWVARIGLRGLLNHCIPDRYRLVIEVQRPEEGQIILEPIRMTITSKLYGDER